MGFLSNPAHALKNITIHRVIIIMDLDMTMFSLTGAFMSYLNSERQIQNSPAILTKYVEKYNDHLKGLFHTMTRNSDDGLAVNHFNGLRKTTKKKKMIFQHFYTNETSQKYSHLFTMYKTGVSLLNDLEKEKERATDEALQLYPDIEFFDFDGMRNGNWIEYSGLSSAMGVEKIISKDVTGVSSKQEYVFSKTPTFDFNVFKDKEKNEWQLGFENNGFAGSKNKEDVEEFREFISEQGQKCWEKVFECRGNLRMINSFPVYYFNTEFKDLHRLLEGTLSIGACSSCVNWFEKKQSRQYKTVLDNFNSDSESWWGPL